MTQDNQKALLALNWLKDPLTKSYIDFLKFKEKFFKDQTALIVESAIVAGNLERIPQEISAFNVLKNYREILGDLLPYFEIANKEADLTEEDLKHLESFFEKFN